MSAAARRKSVRRPRRLSAERLLPLACLAGALLLIASEFMTTFRFEAAGEQVLDLSAALERHAGAMLFLGAFAIVALALALRTGSKPAAIAVAVAGVTAVLLFLIIDLPDAGKVGTFDDEAQTFTQAEAMPEGGFWLTLIGALVLAVCGAALATLGSEQLRALAGRFAAPGPGPGQRSETERRPARGARVDRNKPEKARERGDAEDDADRSGPAAQSASSAARGQSTAK